MLDIFRYTKANTFLRDAFLEKKKNNPSFSLRSWANSLGLKSHAPLHLAIQDKRNIPQRSVSKIAKSLDLSNREALYFETLVNLDVAKDIKDKDFYSRQLKALRPQKKKQLKITEIEAYKCLENPLHMLLIEMTSLKDFKYDLKWIQKRLKIKATLRDIESALERLITLGLIKESPKGKLQKTNAHISNIPDVYNRAVQEYHSNVAKLASDLVFKIPVEERDFTGIALNIKKNSIPRAKKLISDFVDKFIQEIEASNSDGDETFQFNVHFFGTTNNK